MREKVEPDEVGQTTLVIGYAHTIAAPNRRTLSVEEQDRRIRDFVLKKDAALLNVYREQPGSRAGLGFVVAQATAHGNAVILVAQEAEGPDALGFDTVLDMAEARVCMVPDPSGEA